MERPRIWRAKAAILPRLDMSRSKEEISVNGISFRPFAACEVARYAIDHVALTGAQRHEPGDVVGAEILQPAGSL